MKRILFFLCLLLVLVIACETSKEGSSNNNEKLNETDPIESIIDTDIDTGIDAIIPEGWYILKKMTGEFAIAEGDLNKDSISDIAAVIEESIDDADVAPSRALLIAFGSSNGSYTLSIIADRIVLKADEGGVFGDPFEDLSIDRGSVLVSDYGGSNWRWYNKFRFRFQDEDWYLIGATMGEYFNGTHTQENADEEDYNLLTGDYIIQRTDENGEVILEKGNRGKRELIKMKNFNMQDM